MKLWVNYCQVVFWWTRVILLEWINRNSLLSIFETSSGYFTKKIIIKKSQGEIVPWDFNKEVI